MIKNSKSAKAIFLILIFGLLTLTTSCRGYVKKIWEPGSYEEVFQFFILSGNQNYITFLGDEFHYVLEDRYGGIRRLLSFQNRDEFVINTEETLIRVDRNNNLRGRLVIETLSTDLPIDQARLLLQLGFKREAENYKIEIEIRGTRYVNNVQFRGSFLKLSIPYRVNITQEAKINPAKIAAKTVATPFAFVADILVSIGAILIFPFYD